MFMLKLIHNKKTDTRVYIYDHKIIDVDTFNNIMSRWEMYGYNIKHFRCKKPTQEICCWYIK